MLIASVLISRFRRLPLVTIAQLGRPWWVIIQVISKDASIPAWDMIVFTIGLTTLLAVTVILF